MEFQLTQTHLHPSGVQQWHTTVIDGSQDYFAFCSTLSIYVYSTSDFQLKRLIAGHDKCISSLVWCRIRPSQFATASLDGSVCIWDVDNSDDPKVHSINVMSSVYAMDWDPKNSSTLIISTKTSSVYLWDSRKESGQLSLKSMELWHNRNESSPARALVLRWHPNDHSVIAAGNSDGSIRLFDMSTKSLTKVPPVEKGVAVADMRWDPASDVYMLVCNEKGAIRLMDVTTMQNVRTYEREAHVQTVSWMGWAPGSFATCNVRTGVVKVWNVSQSKPMEHKRVGHTGFQSCFVIPGTSRAICSFIDGSVSVFDMRKNQREFLTKPGHTETVFACEYSPNNPDVMATSSYDSTIKIWHTGTMSHQSTLVGQSGVIYSMSWSRCGRYLASCSIKGTVFIWDTTSGESLQRLTHHRRQLPVYCVDWCHGGKCLIASTGGDSTLVVFKDDGFICRRYLLPDAMFGCSWHPKDPNILIAGCADSNAYIFNISEPGGRALMHCLAGHERRVFHTSFSPIDSTLVATGSDDCTVRIWNVQVVGDDVSSSDLQGRHPSSDHIDYDIGAFAEVSNSKVVSDCRVLLGHTSNVRPLLWSPEIPHLLLSGSWDGSIRLWDTRLQGAEACISVGRGHLADVYGLSIHPDRPFFVASTSRDTTVRLWVLTGDSSRMLLGAIRDANLDQYMNMPLSGSASVNLNAILKRSESALERCTEIYNFFGGKSGIQEFWACMAHFLCQTEGENNDGICENTKKHILHKNEIVPSALAEAQNLESIKMRRTSMGGGIGGMKKDEQIRAAAELYARAGDLEKYCNIMFDDLGEHERALAVAPGVSMQFWQELSVRYARICAERLSEDSVPFFAASGKADEAVTFYSRRGQFMESFLVASATNMGSFPAVDDFEISSSARGRDLSFEDEGEAKQGGSDSSSSFVLRTTSAQMAAHYMDRKEPVLAATSFLASDDIHDAMKILMTEDIILAYALALASGDDTYLAKNLQRAEERYGQCSTTRQGGRRKSVKVAVESKDDD